MSKVHQCPLEVRGYEIDSFGHVNHAVYVSYLEHARWKFLEDENIRTSDLDTWKRWPVIAHLDITYLRPTYIGDQLDIRSEVTEFTRASFVVSQEIHRAAEVVLKAKVRVVMVNEKGRPAEMPPEIHRLWTSKPSET